MEPARGPRVVVVSTHFDDAVLSCWSLLNRHGEEARVVTVFGGGPPPGELGWWDAKLPGAMDSQARIRQRSEENRSALALTGSRRIDLDLLETQYGGGRVRPSDLEPYLLDGKTVYAPAGVGRHVHPDHVMVRDAVLQVRPRAVLYADQPYCRFPRDLELAGPGPGYERRLAILTVAEAEKKARAIACYVGEVQLLSLGKRLERPAKEFLYEVLWYPTHGNASAVGSASTAAPQRFHQ